jgi:hypothetical protein
MEGEAERDAGTTKRYLWSEVLSDLEERIIDVKRRLSDLEEGIIDAKRRLKWLRMSIKLVKQRMASGEVEVPPLLRRKRRKKKVHLASPRRSVREPEAT